MAFRRHVELLYHLRNEKHNDAKMTKDQWVHAGNSASSFAFSSRVGVDEQLAVSSFVFQHIFGFRYWDLRAVAEHQQYEFVIELAVSAILAHAILSSKQVHERMAAASELDSFERHFMVPCKQILHTFITQHKRSPDLSLSPTDVHHLRCLTFTWDDFFINTVRERKSRHAAFGRTCRTRPFCKDAACPWYHDGNSSTRVNFGTPAIHEPCDPNCYGSARCY